MERGPSTSHDEEDNNFAMDLDMEVENASDDGKIFTSLESAPYLPDLEENCNVDNVATKVKRTKEEEQVLTNKFLSGELSFTDFAAQYGENDYEETFDDEDDGREKSDEDEAMESSKDDLQIDFQQSIAKVKDSAASKKRPRVRGRTKRNNLPPALKGLIGEANLRYARREHEAAIKMCFEVIRQFPWASEPFETLAQIYEEQGDTEKSLQVSLLAAHLNPRASKHLWIALAEKSEDCKDYKQASTCFINALKCDLKDIELHMKHIALLESIGDNRIVLNAYFKLIKYVDPKEHGEQLIDIAKMLAKRFHEDNKLDRAKEALEIVFNKCSNLINTELINIMLEILISLHEYKKCIEVMVKFCGLEVDVKSSENEDFLLKSCFEPPDLVIDLFAKLVIVIIHLRSFHLLGPFLTKIKSMNQEEAGDVYFDVAEALILEKQFQEALELLIPLTKSSNFDLPAIWLRLAECYKALNKIEDSIKAYTIVIERAPQLLSARLAVSELLNSIGRRKEALAFLTQGEDSDILNPAVLYERCQLLQGHPDQKEQFVAVVHLFLSRHFAHITNRDELNGLLTLKSDRKRALLQDSKNMQKAFEEEEIKGEFSQTFKEPPVEEEWEMFLSACKICVELGRFDTLQRLVFSAQGSQKFSKFSPSIDLLCLSACYYNSDAYFGYNTVRAVVLKNINCQRSWNLFNLMILRADDSRHNRFLMRLLIRNPQHRALTILHANNCLVAGTYKYALSDYTSVYQKENSAMMAFLIAVTLCQMACQKFSAKKHSLVTQSVAYFWKYKDLRGKEGLQESYYNIGRAFHQLGLLPPAVHHYKKSLEIKSKFLEKYSEHLSLQREAAFNLHLIYHASGARDIARMYLEKYCVI